MSYKIVRNASGEVICFGPNAEHYQPSLPTGSVLTIEPNIPPKSAAEREAEQSAAAKLALEKIDRDSIRSIREYIAAKADAPAVLKAYETQAQVERTKVRP